MGNVQPHTGDFPAVPQRVGDSLSPLISIPSAQKACPDELDWHNKALWTGWLTGDVTSVSRGHTSRIKVCRVGVWGGLSLLVWPHLVETVSSSGLSTAVLSDWGLSF